MPSSHKLKEKVQPSVLTVLLNELLADSIDARLAAKQAHWNVRGKNFIALHELFDQVSGEIDAHIDTLAERVVQLGATAQGTLQTAASQSSLAAYPTNIHDAEDHVRALTASLSALADATREGIETATEAQDMVTADILTGITRGLDKLNWLVRSHLA